ncbi:uncharacterized protein Dvir_GJ26462, isoform C [Drosophila virilis]|uniref:Uncharacterized protein, isoform C n=1 Tax=Drosophila virilis TaxID=7244 RepID=A0A0Q9W2R0_DROVI|nr:uncharacterized protein Dvir_GJ26462, isoform C [Drosophila virilis]
MRLLKCCCCISLQFGTMIIGCIFGIKDFSLGCLGIYFVTRKELPVWRSIANLWSNGEKPCVHGTLAYSEFHSTNLYYSHSSA